VATNDTLVYPGLPVLGATVTITEDVLMKFNKFVDCCDAPLAATFNFAPPPAVSWNVPSVNNIPLVLIVN
jgi:hypothetical protein